MCEIVGVLGWLSSAGVAVRGSVHNKGLLFASFFKCCGHTREIPTIYQLFIISIGAIAWLGWLRAKMRRKPRTAAKGNAPAANSKERSSIYSEYRYGCVGPVDEIRDVSHRLTAPVSQFARCGTLPHTMDP